MNLSIAEIIAPSGRKKITRKTTNNPRKVTEVIKRTGTFSCATSDFFAGVFLVDEVSFVFLDLEADAAFSA
jgi:hypothetical protein